LLGEPGIRLGARRWFASPPGIVARTRDAGEPAEQGNGIAGLLRRDEPHAAHRVSLAKQAAAFFRISRSSWSVLTSRRRRRSSSRSSVVRAPGGPWPASTRACCTQRRKDSVAMPRSPAICRMLLPLVCTNCSASARKRSAYGGLLRGIVDSSSGLHAQSWGVHETGSTPLGQMGARWRRVQRTLGHKQDPARVATATQTLDALKKGPLPTASPLSTLMSAASVRASR